VEVTITDDDGGSGTATSPTVTVYNENPAASIDSITDETGAVVGAAIRPVLTNTRIRLQGSFTDVGTRDTHLASVDWGDGRSNSGSSTGSIAVGHVYGLPGLFTAVLQVTDDDTGVGTAQAAIKVIDSAEAVSMLAGDLAGETAMSAALNPAGGESQALSARRAAKLSSEQPATAIAAFALDSHRSNGDPIAEAVNKLIGSDGALEMLEKGNLNAALVKMWQAMGSLEAAGQLDAALDLASSKSLLALSAKSAAMESILDAEAKADKPGDIRKIADALALVDVADELLAGLNYVDAVDVYRQAAQEVQGIQ
jgi:hypothetical protein